MNDSETSVLPVEEIKNSMVKTTDRAPGGQGSQPGKKARPQAVTMVLPGDGRSGGVRVTAIMANLLRDRGYKVRIASKKAKFSLRAAFVSLRQKLKGKPKGQKGFLHVFRGNIEEFTNLDDLSWQPGEIVIAVGTYTVGLVQAMKADVLKVRFNHGFPAKPTPDQDLAWQGPLPTITVSRTLVPRLQELTGGNVWGVVPNGVETSEYFMDPEIPRTGIGALYSRHPNKAPDDLIAVLQEAHRKWPDVPQNVFGTEPCPAGLEHVNYTQLPPVAEARAIYNRSKVWIVASLTEGLPGVVLEAMSCGCTIVSSDNEGSMEIITNGENGLLVPRRDRPAFVEAIGRCLENDDLRSRLTAGASETLKRFTWPAAADSMEEFLSAISSQASLPVKPGQ